MENWKTAEDEKILMRKFQTITTIVVVPSLNQNFNYQQIIVFNKLSSWNRLQTCKNLINIFSHSVSEISSQSSSSSLAPFWEYISHITCSYPYILTEILYVFYITSESNQFGWKTSSFLLLLLFFPSMIIFDFHLISLINKIFINTPLSSLVSPSSSYWIHGKLR